MKENEGVEAECNDIITNLMDESVVSHKFDELSQRTPEYFLEVNQHETSTRDYQEENAINQVFGHKALQARIYLTLLQHFIVPEIRLVGREVKQKVTEVEINGISYPVVVFSSETVLYI